MELSTSLFFEPYMIDTVSLLSCNAVCMKKKIVDTWRLHD
jgi:hypothetical protein